MKRGALGAMAMAVIGGCATGTPDAGFPGQLDYRWGEALPMSGDLVQVLVGVGNATEASDVSDYADCVAAKYALTTGSAFARHVRTTLSVEGGVWQGDAVYTMSPALPEGLRTIDAETRVAACLESGIPLA